MCRAMITRTLQIICLVVVPIAAGPNTTIAAESSARGKVVFERNCAVCHGTGGDGGGPEAQRFFTRPTDFRRGIFKFRSTPSGSLPTDQDLERTILRGLPGSGMVSQEHLSTAEIRDVIAYLKILSSRWQEVPSERSVPIIRPKDQALLTSKGPENFKKAGCPECHGERGRGDGPSATSLTSQNRPIRPADLTRRPLKGGDQPEDIYRILLTGMDGTPMPSYRDALDQDDMWALAIYVSGLAQTNTLSQPTNDERIGWEIETKHQGRRPPR
jgi:mono/diheme cytochrome c family protein